MSQKNNKIYDMPNKESIRGSHNKKGWDRKMQDQGSRNYKIVSRYIDRCLCKSIGKNFDKVKKHIYPYGIIIMRSEQEYGDRVDRRRHQKRAYDTVLHSVLRYSQQA